MLGRAASTFALLALCSCNSAAGLIDGPYRLEITDVAEDAMVCYELDHGACVGRVPQTVFAVGFNRAYVIAARHPHRFQDTSLDRSRTEYFYIIRSVDGPLVDPSQSVRGPFDKTSFQQDQKRLGLPDITREIGGLR